MRTSTVTLLMLCLGATTAKPLVRSVTVAAVVQPKMPAPALKIEVRRDENATTLVAIGPVLGPMDSRDVAAEAVCNAAGDLVLTATITRSAQNAGDDARKYVLWRPRITVIVVPKHERFVFRTIWRMRLTTGGDVKRIEMPPYGAQIYPIIVSKTVPRR